MPKVQIRVTDRERERLHELAEATGMSMSAFVKSRVLGVEQTGRGSARGASVPSAERPSVTTVPAKMFECPCGQTVARSPKAVCGKCGRKVR